jgi:hypothetical protein
MAVLLPQLLAADADKDVSFFVIGKTPTYQQNADGKIVHQKHYMFGEIFLRDGGALKSATLIPPEGSKYNSMDFQHAGHVWKVERQDFAGLEELDNAFPDGDYLVIMETAAGNKYKESVSLRFPDNNREFTQTISIYFYQGGRLVKRETIDPKQDLLIAWSPFSKGHQDPRGISDDLIFAISSDCNDQPFARSALPFVAIPALSYNDSQFRIPADRLQPGSRYELVVEHAEMVDTKKADSGIIGLATFPTVTKTSFRTSGPANTDCPVQ